jgi:conserved hypothetical protein, YfiH family
MKMYNIIYINQDKTTEIKVENGVPYIVFKNLELPGIVHGFSTRLGGVSEGIYSTMNLSFHRGDDMDAVMENHRRLAQAVGYDHRRLVFSDQVHETVIRKVTEEDAGKGITRESDITETDGLMTNVKDLPLITFYADCVPVFFYDPVKEVVAMNHSGWRGTVKNISRHMVEALNKEYGCEASDLICAVGPSICQNCYEVSEDVAEAFKDAYLPEQYMKMTKNIGNGKYLLDLHRANYYNLTGAGILPEHINVTDICTCCNPDFLFSHRASHGKRGNLGAVIMLKSTADGGNVNE